MITLIPILFKLLVLHSPDGHEIDLNKGEIVSIREPQGNEGHMSSKVHCVINTVDGKFTPVRETCMEVLEMAK